MEIKSKLAPVVEEKEELHESPGLEPTKKSSKLPDKNVDIDRVKYITNKFVDGIDGQFNHTIR
tara:strand:+ start:89 stop:277 length:189 start_codon:yes stop_codon:yes gene_type:complete